MLLGVLSLVRGIPVRLRLTSLRHKHLHCLAENTPFFATEPKELTDDVAAQLFYESAKLFAYDGDPGQPMQATLQTTRTESAKPAHEMPSCSWTEPGE